MKRHFFLLGIIITMFAFSNSHAQNLKISGCLTFGKVIFTSDNPDNDGVDFESKPGFIGYRKRFGDDQHHNAGNKIFHC